MQSLFPTSVFSSLCAESGLILLWVVSGAGELKQQILLWLSVDVSNSCLQQQDLVSFSLK